MVNCRICGKELNDNEGMHISMTILLPGQTSLCLSSYCMECFDKHIYHPLSDLNYKGKLGITMNTTKEG
jgi:hypothetical protein